MTNAEKFIEIFGFDPSPGILQTHNIYDMNWWKANYEEPNHKEDPKMKVLLEMEMPKTCGTCPFSVYGFDEECFCELAAGPKDHVENYDDVRSDKCPLKPLRFTVASVYDIIKEYLDPDAVFTYELAERIVNGLTADSEGKEEKQNG